MKKFFIFAASAALLWSCSPKNQYVIEGQIEGANPTVYLFTQENNLLDSAAVKDGSFQIKGIAEEPQVAVLRDAREESATFVAMLLLEPGTITVSDDPDSPFRKRVSGTPANDASTAYGDAGNKLVQEYRDSATTEERRTAIEEEYDVLTRQTVDQNRDNIFGALLLAQQLGFDLSGQELLDEIAKFSPEMQQNQLLVDLKERAEAKMKTDIGQPYIDVVQPDADGNEVSLKSVVENPANKYVLLDFWASWCGPCMGEVPHLKRTYDEFHKKGFEIFGVTFDDNREDWLDAVKENKMNWVHVGLLNGFDNQAAKDYAVNAIPSNFLIDSEGKIVAKNLRGEALYEKIAELLQ